MTCTPIRITTSSSALDLGSAKDLGSAGNRSSGGPRDRSHTRAAVCAREESGSVTAETAMALPALVVILLLALWVLLSVAAQLRCVDAAHVGARAAARGETDTVVAGAAQRVAPEAAQVRVSRSDGQVEVEVRASVQPFSAVLRLLPSVEVSARAVAADEAEP